MARKFIDLSPGMGGSPPPAQGTGSRFIDLSPGMGGFSPAPVASFQAQDDSDLYDFNTQLGQLNRKRRMMGLPPIRLPEGAVLTERISDVVGPVPGDAGMQDPGLLNLAGEGFKEGVVSPFAGLAERVGLVPEGTRTEMREDFEATREAYLAANPTATRAALAGAAEFLPMLGSAAIPSATPARAVQAASKVLRVGPRVAKGLLGAAEGAAYGLGETAGQGALETALGIGLGGVAGGAGSMLAPPRDLQPIDDVAGKFDNLLKDMLGDPNDLPTYVRERQFQQQGAARVWRDRAQQESHRMQQAVASYSRKSGVPIEQLDLKVAEAMANPKRMRQLPPDLRTAAQKMRKRHDDLTQELINGPVDDVLTFQSEQYTRRYNKANAKEIKANEKWPMTAKRAKQEWIQLARDPEMEALIDPSDVNIWKIARFRNTLEKNKGKYLHRSYLSWDDPNWAKGVRARARDLRIRTGKGQPLTSADEAWKANYDLVHEDVSNRLFRQIALQKRKAYFIVDRNGKRIGNTPQGRQAVDQEIFNMLDHTDPYQAYYGAGQLPKADLSWTKKRKKLPEHVRVIYGEITDPYQRYERSMSMVGADLETYRFMKDVRQWALENPDRARTVNRRGLPSDLAVPDERFQFEIIGDARRSPLSGNLQAGMPRVYVDDEALADALNGAVEKMPVNSLNAMNMMVHLMKTVWSVQTHARNFVGNMGFLTMNGHNPFSRTTMKTSWDVAKLQRLSKNKRLNLDLPEMEEAIQLHEMLVSDGTMTSVAKGDLQRMLRQVKEGNLKHAPSKSPVQWVGRLAEKVGESRASQTLTDWYQLEDSLWKIYGLKKEIDRFIKVGFGQDEAEAMAREVLKGMLPVYGRVPKVTQILRNTPLVGPFVSFPSEVIRTFYKTTQRAMAEIASQDPRLRKVGAQRLAGMAATTTAGGALGFAGQQIAGLSQEQDAAVKGLMAGPWERDSHLMYLGFDDETGDAQWIDASYALPHSVITGPVVNVVRALRDPNIGAARMAKMTFIDFVENFVGPEIVASELVSMVRDLSRVSEMGADEKLKVVLARAYRTFAPGTVISAERLIRATGMLDSVLPSKTPWGHEYTMGTEASALVGPRIRAANVDEALGWKAKDFSRGYGQARNLVKKERYRSPERLLRATDNAKREFEEMAKRLQRNVNRARILNRPEKTILKVLLDAGVSKTQADAIMRGEIPEFTPPKFEGK